ncbi:MAG: polysaccharide biosynthesis C-terminal domain-containing protein [Bacteroidia bacterium]
MGVIQRQGLQSAVITYAGMITGFLSLLVIQPWLLTAEEIGLTRVLYSFSFLISTVLPLSAGNITTKFFPRFRNAEKKHHGFLGLILLFPILGAAIVFPVLYFLKDFIAGRYIDESPLFVEYLLYALPLSFLFALIGIINNYLFAIFRPLLPALAQEVLIRIFFIVLIIFYSLGYLNLDQFVLAYVGTFVVQILILGIQIVRIGNFSLIPDFKVFTKPVIREMGIFGFTVFGAGIASMAIKLFDAVILGQFVPLALVGVYGVAAFIPTFIEAPVNALDKVANSRIANSWQHGDMENIKEIYYKSSRYLYVLGGFLFLMVVLNVKFLFTLLPGIFVAGIPVVKILSLAALFNLMTGSNTAIIFNSSRFKAGAAALIGVAILNLIMLFVLIPAYGLIGAAWATCISSFAYNFFKFAFIRLRFKLQPFDIRTLYITGAIVAAYFATSFLPLFGTVILDVLSHALLGSLIYAWLIWFSKSAEDLIELIPFRRKKD